MCSSRNRDNLIRDFIVPIGGWNTEEFSSSNRKQYKDWSFYAILCRAWNEVSFAEGRLSHTCSNHYINFIHHMSHYHLNSLLKGVCFSIITNYMPSADTLEWVSVPAALDSSTKPHLEDFHHYFFFHWVFVTFLKLGFCSKFRTSLSTLSLNLTSHLWAVVPDISWKSWRIMWLPLMRDAASDGDKNLLPISPSAGKEDL